MSSPRSPREPQSERQDSGGGSWAPAILLGVAVIAASLILRSSLEKTNLKLDEMRTALVDTRQALQTLAAARPAAPQPPKPGPDPNRRYEVNVAGAPAKGPAKAKIQIVEFSDFQ